MKIKSGNIAKKKKGGCKGCHYYNSDINILGAFLLANRVEILSQEEFEDVKQAIQRLINRNKNITNALKQIYANLEILDIDGSKEIIRELMEE